MQKSSEILGDSQEFMEILSEVPEIVTDLQKILLKSLEDFKFSCETQGDNIKIEVLIQKDSVKQKEEEWISNEGNNTYSWPLGYGITENTMIEIIKRDARRATGQAGMWAIFWKETDRSDGDIVKFRIIK